MGETIYLAVMALDAFRFAIPLELVDRVCRAAEVTPLPEAPPAVLGILNIQGRIAVAVNLRKRCRLPERPIDPADQFVLAYASGRLVALAVDHVAMMRFSADAVTPPDDDIMRANDFVRGIIKGEEGLTLVCDPFALLSIEEEQTLCAAMSRRVQSALLMDSI